MKMRNLPEFRYTFPIAKFVASNTLVQQLAHVQSEVNEIAAEINGKSGFTTIAEEAMDLLHSTETLLSILQFRHGVNLDLVAHNIEIKNRARGYYE